MAARVIIAQRRAVALGRLSSAGRELAALAGTAAPILEGISKNIQIEEVERLERLAGLLEALLCSSTFPGPPALSPDDSPECPRCGGPMVKTFVEHGDKSGWLCGFTCTCYESDEPKSAEEA